MGLLAIPDEVENIEEDKLLPEEEVFAFQIVEAKEATANDDKTPQVNMIVVATEEDGFAPIFHSLMWAKPDDSAKSARFKTILFRRFLELVGMWPLEGDLDPDMLLDRTFSCEVEVNEYKGKKSNRLVLPQFGQDD